VVYLRGGHDGDGDEVTPLDEGAARAAILAQRDQVEAFAVSGYFGVRNPAHELRTRALIEELTTSVDGQPLPVTCGHELTTRLNSVRRATTAALNARLIPLLRELIATVRHTLGRLGVHAPLMVVKGDGSLVRAEWAMRRPIETILSGPAASVVGAAHLAGRGDVWVVDVGGTTTDIAALHDGRPRLNPEGAQVGAWRTMVEAVDAHTVGLGGDSVVRLDAAGNLQIGPRRVVPLCTLASLYPGVVEELRLQLGDSPRESIAAQFVLVQRQPQTDPSRTAPTWLSEADRDLLARLGTKPRSLDGIVDELRYGSLAVQRIESLEARRLLLRSGFTPTDALHVLGRFEDWNAEASRLGARVLARQARLPVTEFCERVVDGVSDRVTTALISKLLGDEEELPDWEREPSARAFLSRALGNVPGSDLACTLKVRQPIVAVGAPVKAYMPRVARQLDTELVITPNADVANAVGAVAGSVVQQLEVKIRPIDGQRLYRLHLPDGVRDFDSVDAGVAYAHRVVPDRLRTLAQRAGADQVELRIERVDRNAPVRASWGESIYLGTQLTFTAVGRPSSVERGS
jgi:N-methylhydantoinase A/oxoprolinase/acetone carboxylase beta subunit